MKIQANDACPCGSGQKFKRCCRAAHRGEAPGAPSDLVRARYSAYVVGDVAFIQASTHPAAGQYRADRQQWAREILEFSRSTRFEGLEILDAAEEEEQAEVTFVARLRDLEGNDVSFQERSQFRRHNGAWLYLAALQPES